MNRSIKDIRISTIVVIIFLITIFYINIKQRNIKNPQKDLDISNRIDPVEKIFYEFDVNLKEVSKSISLNQKNNTFIILPNEKKIGIACILNLSLAHNIRRKVIKFNWYKENKIMFSEQKTIYSDTKSIISNMNIERSQYGLWSIDILVNNKLLLQTISFNVRLKIPERRY